MFKRLAMWLLLSMGLIALASPVLACEVLSGPVRDCCPEGAPSPCKGGLPAADAVCCVAAPASTQVVAIQPQRAEHPLPADSHNPDPLILAAWVHTLASYSSPHVPFRDIRLKPGADDTQIYLQTRRLRL